MRIARKGAAKLVDSLAQSLVALGLALLLVSIGVRYVADDDDVEAATVAMVSTAGQRAVAEDYATLKKQVVALKARVAALVPDRWRAEARPFTIGVGVGALVFGIGLALARAPSRAHAVRDIGWAVVAPGVVAAFVLLVLDWRAATALGEAIEQGRKVDEARADAELGAREGGLVLLPALAAGTAILLAGMALRRRDTGEGELRLRAVFGRFLFTLGVVPLLHLSALVVLAALSRGRAIGPALEPLSRPLSYLIVSAVFALGVAVWRSGRAEVKRVELEDGA